MPTAQIAVTVRSTAEEVFDLIHDYSCRLDWDPFLREARLLGDATVAAKGVSSLCVARRGAGGMAMETVYVTFSRPRVAAVRMTKGPFFLRTFAASIRQEPIDPRQVRVTYRYRFTVRPRCLAHLLEPVIGWVFRRETLRRLTALKHHHETR